MAPQITYDRFGIRLLVKFGKSRGKTESKSAIAVTPYKPTERLILPQYFHIKINKFKHKHCIAEHKARQQTYKAQMHIWESDK